MMHFVKILLVVLMVVTYNIVFSQSETVEIVYAKYVNEKLDTNFSFSLWYNNNIAFLPGKNDNIKSYIDFNRGANVDMISYQENNYKTLTIFDSLPKPVFTDDTESILAYDCNKAIFKAFSNKIEVWYTKEAMAKGSPYKDYLPKNSLVLKVVINGNRKLIATEILKKDPDQGFVYPYDEAISITKAKYRELQIKSRYISVPVFRKQQINFEKSIENVDFGKSNIVYRFSKGTVILKKIKLPKINKEGASAYATLTNWSNGDAYDRTGSVFTISTHKEKSVLDAFINGLGELPVIYGNNKAKYQGVVNTENYDVPVELMRFFTSFGVSHFNDKRKINNYEWRDSVVYKQEITSLIPNTEEEIWIGVFIGNYDKGGHKVSLNLDFYPAWEEEEFKEKWIRPLFNTLNILEMSGQNYGKMFKDDTLKTSFNIPEDIDDLQLLFTTTGHGGWGNGDEFNPKLNQVLIDGELVFNHVPWRTDCASYRLSNPASGNFQNGLSSSDLSRSNWCPATLTPPFFIPLDNLSPGQHSIEIIIDQGDDEGSSFNHWGVSGVLVGIKSK